MNLYLENFKKLGTVSYLPKFAIIHFNNFTNILYLPNQNTEMKLLGKWSSNWYSSDSFLIGHIEQDNKRNIIFVICAYYRFNKDILENFSRIDFKKFWDEHYMNDLFITPFHFLLSTDFISENHKINSIIPSNSNKDIPTTNQKSYREENTKNNYKETIMSRSGCSSTHNVTSVKEKYKNNKYKFDECVISEPTIYKNREEINTKLINVDKNVHTKYLVCKTDKPEIYHVYNQNKYLATCLIPNIKTSQYMNSVFENLSIGKFIELSLKLHDKSNKYIPIIE